MSSQPSLLELVDVGLCCYGTGGARYYGPGSVCPEPATHGARWARNGKSGGIDCCLDHANYYANAWVPYYPADASSAWIDILEVA